MISNSLSSVRQDPPLSPDDKIQKNKKIISMIKIDVAKLFAPVIIPFAYINIQEKDPISRFSFLELIEEQKKKKLPYILALCQDEDSSNFHYFDALNLRTWNKKSTLNPLTAKKINRIFLFTIINYTNTKNDLFNYLGHTKEEGQRKVFVDNFCDAMIDFKAQTRIGCCYYEGNGVIQDFEKAVYWFTKAAKKGDELAQYNLGFCYLEGQGVIQDLEKAVYWFTQAAEKGDEDAQFYLGGCYYEGQGVIQDFEKAVYLLTQSAEKGNAEAQFLLGDCYHEGQGVIQDLEKAVYWYTQSAQKGNVDAQNNLGLCYDRGEGVIQDFEKAVYWYTQAAEKGVTAAQYNLALCYYEGNGVIQDIEKAIYWYTQAAQKGDAEAQYNLGALSNH